MSMKGIYEGIIKCNPKVLKRLYFILKTYLSIFLLTSFIFSDRNYRSNLIPNFKIKIKCL